MGREQVGILGVEGLREEFRVLPEDLEVFLEETRSETVIHPPKKETHHQRDRIAHEELLLLAGAGVCVDPALVAERGSRGLAVEVRREHIPEL